VINNSMNKVNSVVWKRLVASALNREISASARWNSTMPMSMMDKIIINYYHHDKYNYKFSKDSLSKIKDDYHNHNHHHNGYYHNSMGGYTSSVNSYLIAIAIVIAISLNADSINHCDDNFSDNYPSLKITQPYDIYDKLKLRLLEFLLPSQIEMNLEELKQRGKPWNSYHRCERHPQMIVCPSSTEQVSRIVKICNELRIPLVAFGGGTSIEGQTLALDGGVSLDFSNMKAIIALNEEDLDVHVEAGLGYLELNEVLKPKGLWFPLDPGPGASVGGGS